MDKSSATSKCFAQKISNTTKLVNRPLYTSQVYIQEFISIACYSMICITNLNIVHEAHRNMTHTDTRWKDTLENTFGMLHTMCLLGSEGQDDHDGGSLDLLLIEEAIQKFCLPREAIIFLFKCPWQDLKQLTRRQLFFSNVRSNGWPQNAQYRCSLLLHFPHWAFFFTYNSTLYM